MLGYFILCKINFKCEKRKYKSCIYSFYFVILLLFEVIWEIYKKNFFLKWYMC